MTKKYLGYAIEAGQMGNWTAMIPGLIDVGYLWDLSYDMTYNTFFNAVNGHVIFEIWRLGNNSLSH